MYSDIVCIQILFSFVVGQNAPHNLPYQEDDAWF